MTLSQRSSAPSTLSIVLPSPARGPSSRAAARALSTVPDNRPAMCSDRIRS
jgi:hypothetical protein